MTALSITPPLSAPLLDVDGLRYSDTGQGDALIVLNGSSTQGDARMHSLLTKERRLIAFDGLKLSEQQPQKLAAGLNKAIAGIGLDRVSLIAHGVGAQLALWMALENPKAIDTLVLMAPIALSTDIASQNTDLESRLGELTMPILALFGTRDTVVPTGMARLYASLLPKCFTTMVYNATHTMDGDRPEAVAAIVSEFLRHREGFVVNRNSGLLHP